MAEWWLKSKRVQNAIRGQAREPFDVAQRISVPAKVYEWKAAPATRKQALDVQDRNREMFLKAFAGDLVALGYERDQQGNGTFLLGRWDETWKY